MKTIILTTIIATAAMAAAAQTEADSVVLAGSESTLLPTKSIYTLTLRDVQLKGAGQTATIKIRTGANANGVNINLAEKDITIYNAIDTVQVAAMLIDGLKKHDYTIIKSSRISIYRDGVEMGSLATSNFKDGNRIVIDNASALAAGYSLELTSDGSRVVPNIAANENNLSNMLSDFENLAADPYFNSGLARTGINTEGRNQYFQSSVNAGDGSNIWIETEDVYSGPSCVGMRSISGEETKTTLEQEVTFKAGTPYVVRAMIKSNGWVGSLGIKNQENAIHIKDTNGKWIQVEGVLSSSTAATAIQLYADADNADGTVYIDNLEIYEGANNTSKVNSEHKAVMAGIAAGNVWNPTTATEVYRLKLTEKNAETYAQINPEVVKVTGAPIFTRSFTGSKMEAIFFPYGVSNITVSGTFDYRNFYEYPLFNGLDFVLQRFDTQSGRFQYLEDDAELAPGAYIIQFADNYDGQDVTFDFNPTQKFDDSYGSNKFSIIGNGTCADQRVDVDSWNEYYYNADKQCFDNIGSEGSNALKTRPFLYSITSLATDAPSVIAPDGVNGIQRLAAAKGGNAFVVRPMEKGAEIISRTRGNLPIYNLTGMRVKDLQIENGINQVNLPSGFYIIAGKKIVVR